LLAENEKPRYNARLFAHLRKKVGVLQHEFMPETAPAFCKLAPTNRSREWRKR
jgi:hypothetical protein